MSCRKNVAFDTNELELFRSGIVSARDYTMLTEGEQETLKFAYNTLLENFGRILAPLSAQVLESPSEDIDN